MKYCITLLRVISFCLVVSNSLAQDNIEDVIATLNKINQVNNVQVFVHDKPISDWSGVSRHVKFRDFLVAFDSTASRTYSNLTISEATISLIRNNKRIGMAFWRPEGCEPLNVFYALVQLGDRYEIQFTLIAQRKTGEQVSLANKLIYNLPLL